MEKKKGMPKWFKVVLYVVGVIIWIRVLGMFLGAHKVVPTPTPTATNTAVPTETSTPIPSRTPAPTKTPYPTATERPESCNIKGNRNTKIYHCKNSPNYDMTNDFIQWFCSPEEAESAGYRPAETMGGVCQQ